MKAVQENLETLPEAVVDGNTVLCPRCWKLLCIRIPGGGGVILWCRGCKSSVLLRKE